jgi:hypothetical protein
MYRQDLMNGNAYQNGGEGYPSAAYHASLTEQQMQVPYPDKNFAKGGMSVMEGVGAGLEGLKGFGSGYGLGSSLTDDVYGDKNVAGAIGSGAMAAGSMAETIGQGVEEQQAFDQEVENAQISSNQSQADAIAAAEAASAGIAVPTSTPEGNMVDDPYGYGAQPNPNAAFMAQHGGRAYYEHGGMMQDANGMMIMVIEAAPLETTLADLQGMANPYNWGTMEEGEDTMRHNTNLMGRVHRGPKHDGSAMISGSEKGGPRPAMSPRKKTFRMGGRMYTSNLYKRSLTLSIV